MGMNTNAYIRLPETKTFVIFPKLSRKRQLSRKKETIITKISNGKKASIAKRNGIA